MATETVDSDDEYLYGREGQNIATPPPEDAQEETAPPSSEMADLVMIDESLPPQTMDEAPDPVSPDQGEETLAPDTGNDLVTDTPTDASVAPELKPAEGSGLPDSHVSVIQQSPHDTGGNSANARASSEDEDDADSTPSDDGVHIMIGESNSITMPAAVVKLPTEYPLTAPYRSSVPSAQISKQLDINAVGKVNGVSIYDYDIDATFDEKPWRKPGADITDYFNYGFTEDSWKAYSLKQKQLRQDYKPLPTILDDVSKKEIGVIGEKQPPIKHEIGLGPMPDFAPPMFHPLLQMPPPGMPPLGQGFPHMVGVPTLDPLGLPPPIHGPYLPPPGLPPFQHEPGRELFPPPFMPPGGFRDPGMFPEHVYPDFMQEFLTMEKRNSRSPSFSSRRRPSLETLSANSFSSEGSHGRSRFPLRDESHNYHGYKRGRRRHSPREHHHHHRENREHRDRDRERDRDRDREMEYRGHERLRHREKGQEVAEKHHDRMREREARERVVKRLGERGAVPSERESRSRHDRKKHREMGNHDGSPHRRRAKKSRHGTDSSPPPS